MSWLRRSSAEGREPVDAFMQAFYEGTDAHPFMPNARIYNNETVLEVAPFQGGVGPDYEWDVILKWIQALEPGQGQATRALEWLTALADEYGVFIELTAQPTGEPKIPKKKLKQFYGDQGFEGMRGRPDDMMRSPDAGETE